LIGRLGKDPQIKETPDSKKYCRVPLAVNKGKDTEPVWFSLLFFDKSADLIVSYSKKGNEIFIEGEIKIESFKSNDDQEKKIINVFVKSFQFLQKKDTVNENFENNQKNLDYPF